jgi:predicted nucleotidyltransferase
VVLFGSRAVNTASKYSDYDILLVLKKDFDWRLEDAILSSCYEIDLKYDIVTDVKLISGKDLNSMKGRQPFILNALEHGLMV